MRHIENYYNRDDYDEHPYSERCSCDDCRGARYLKTGRLMDVPEQLQYQWDDDEKWRTGEGDWEAHWFGIERLDRAHVSSSERNPYRRTMDTRPL